MTDEQPEQDDSVLIDVASELTRVAQITGDLKVIELMQHAYKMLSPTAMATLMLRYNALKQREEELENEIEQAETHFRRVG